MTTLHPGHPLAKLRLYCSTHEAITEIRPLDTFRLTSNGRPCVFSYFGGAHGYCGEYLTVDGRVASIRADGDSVRDALDTDRLATRSNGELVRIPTSYRL
jgi:hypothetical protein